MKFFRNPLTILLSLCLLFTCSLPVHAEESTVLLSKYGYTVDQREFMVDKAMAELQQLYLYKDYINNLNKIIEANNVTASLAHTREVEDCESSYDAYEKAVLEFEDNWKQLQQDFDNGSDASLLTSIRRAQASEARVKTSKGNLKSSSDLILNSVYDLSDVEEQIKTSEINVIDLYKDIDDIGEVNSISWILPNTRKVTSTYGYRSDPMNTKEEIIQFHSGTDYVAREGTEVGALFNGIVVATGYSTTGGNYVKVKVTDDISYAYFHLSKILVEVGDMVEQYQTVALSGGTGTRSTGPHLHLNLYIYGLTVNPDILFGG